MTDETPPIRQMAGDNTAPRALRPAVQERLLTGDDDRQRVQQAAALGVGGIEFAAAGLGERVEVLGAVLRDSPVVAAAVRLGAGHNFLSPDKPTRQRALDALRYAMTDAADLDAAGVVIVPHRGAALGLPDLMPLKAPVQLAVELMTMHLRTLADLAYVFGVKLYLQPVNQYESAFLNRLAEGVELRRRIKFSPHVLLAADTYHMHMTEDHPGKALHAVAESVGQVYLAAHNGALPGAGETNAAVVRDAGITGWAVVTRHQPGTMPQPHALQAAIDHLQALGF